MAKPAARVRVPRSARKGDIVTIKTLLKSHKMESGLRKDRKTGTLVPRKIVNRFVAKFNGQEVFTVDIEPAVSANPFLEFNVKVEESGTFEFQWIDDDGSIYSAKSRIEVN